MPGSIVVGILLAATIWALVRKPMWGFLGAWFFLILAPTSSFMPIRDLAFEQRMYLPLAAVVALAVLAAHLLGERLAARRGFGRGAPAHPDRGGDRPDAAADDRAGLADVRSEPGLPRPHLDLDRRDEGEPGNARAWNNLGEICYYGGPFRRGEDGLRGGRQAGPRLRRRLQQSRARLRRDELLDEALRDYDEAIRLNPNVADAFINRGNVYDALGRSQDALREYGLAIEANPDNSLIYLNRAITYYRLKEYAKALADLDHTGSRRGAVRVASRGHHAGRGADAPARDRAKGKRGVRPPLRGSSSGW